MKGLYLSPYIFQHYLSHYSTFFYLEQEGPLQNLSCSPSFFRHCTSSHLSPPGALGLKRLDNLSQEAFIVHKPSHHHPPKKSTFKSFTFCIKPKSPTYNNITFLIRVVQLDKDPWLAQGQPIFTHTHTQVYSKVRSLWH